MCLSVFLVFVAFAVVSFGASEIYVPFGFIGFALLCLVPGICFFCAIKPLKRNDNKSMKFNFYDSYMEVREVKAAKEKILTICLYAAYKNKQFVSKVVESGDGIEIKVYTGTYNGVPKYARYDVPKDVVGADKIEEFTSFLKERVGSSYVVK